MEHLPWDLDITSNKARILGLELGKYTEGLTLIKKNLVKNPNHKGLLCNEAEILEKMKDTESAIPIKEKLKKLYSANYKCGFFKKTGIGEILGQSFV